MKKLLALALTLLMIFALVGCGGKRREPIQLTLSTEDSEAILNAAGIRLPDAETVGEVATVKWFSWYDPFQNYDEDEMVNTGFYTFQQKYGGTLEWIEVDYGEKNTRLATLVLSGDSPDMTLAGTSNTATFPLDCIKGMYQPIDSYIDYTNPLWSGMADAAEYFALGDKHFAMVTDVTFKDIIPYNRRVMNEWGFDDPAELFYDDEWTWDVFAEMCKDFSNPDDNRYALDGWYYVIGLSEEATGQYLIQKDEDGKYYSNLDDPYIEVAMNLIYDLYKNECMYHEGTNYWARRGNVSGTGVKDGTCLFCPIALMEALAQPVSDVSALWGDITEGEVMFVPFPRYENGDGKYYINSQPTGYMLCSGARNAEGAALLASCMRFKILDPTVVNIDRKLLKEVYMWNDEMLAMWDICKELGEADVRMFYTGNLPTNLQNAVDALSTGINRTGAANTWAQLKEANREKVDFYLEELNATIEQYVETGSAEGYSLQ